ncbi:peptide chain release factor N(5)-glutamine methyltransferase [Rickettsiales bacterium]|nr:peptide chain release factor N(5)-glutamine methyltransferase [Rickettsiales bacterium]
MGVKIKELLNYSSNFLKNAKIPSYNLDALLILCNSLSATKEEVIFSKVEDDLVQKNLEKIKSLLVRRSNKEPLSHIIGHREFYDDIFLVNQDVLDPRPDSEVLIESVFNIFDNKNKTIKILELGVGSGCLLLSVLKKFVNAFGVGVDISMKALNVALQNADKMNLADRVNLINSDWFTNIEDQEFDLIISNPPYIESKQIDNLQDEVKNFEPKIALDGGLSGLDCYKKIASNINKFLIKEGYLFLEIGIGQENEVIKIFQDTNLKLIEQKKDLAGIVRCLIFRK